jgi:L-lysine exporter family protein LysE/ArgO
MGGSDAGAALLAGLGSGASLIIAIGAQNAFVLRQGVRREHVLTIVFICTLSDMALIFAGVVGIGALTRTAPLVLEIARLAGAAFLLGYAALAARRAIRGEALDTSASTTRSWGTIALTCLALTWLNPHVYLDTMVVLGTLATAHGPNGRWWFAAGAMLASACWFSALGFGSRALTGMLARPIAWRIIDSAIAVLMVVLAIGLLIP